MNLFQLTGQRMGKLSLKTNMFAQLNHNIEQVMLSAQPESAGFDRINFSTFKRNYDF
jgi:hypothetical protein